MLGFAYDLCRARYFGIETPSILGAPTPGLSGGRCYIVIIIIIALLLLLLICIIIIIMGRGLAARSMLGPSFHTNQYRNCPLEAVLEVLREEPYDFIVNAIITIIKFCYYS